MVKFNQDQGAWDAERMEHLRRLWNSGMSAAEIARILQTSRNSVIGKSHRMGLKARPHPIKDRVVRQYLNGMTPEEEFKERRNKQQRELVAKKRAVKKAIAAGEAPPVQAEAPKSAPAPAPKARAPRVVLPDPAGPLTLEQVQQRNGCRWPSGHRPNMTFCGRDRHTADDPAVSYCLEHHVRSIGHHQPARLRAA